MPGVPARVVRRRRQSAVGAALAPVGLPFQARAMAGRAVRPIHLLPERRDGRIVRPQASWLGRAAGTAAFAGGYLVAWAIFGVLAAVAASLVDVDRGWLGPLLVVAGVFQITPLKQACLTHCRNPLSFLLVRWRSGPGPALRLGALHGMYCVGCCWALMLVMLAVGAAAMAWMIAIALVVFLEQVAPGGARLRLPLALALVAAGLWIWLPSAALRLLS